ncbi:hypothetical protein CPB85DRAFT_1440856 [Mucidula mucida]|nr:hypothetical protein CPB85DRAFT_1440856 [Mucidula mucida]
MVDFMALNGVVLIAASVARAASVAHLLDTLAECGDGVCETGTECATGEVAGGDNDTALAYTEVIGYGRPVVPFGYVPSGTQVNVWEGCTDSNFAGTCLIVDVGCNGCFHLEGVFVNSLSSIKILVPNIGCDFWTSLDCVGVGISIRPSQFLYFNDTMEPQCSDINMDF